MGRPAPDLPVTTDDKCRGCSGSLCCTYVTQKILAPRTRADFDHLLWQVAHRGVQVFKDGSGWHLLIHAPCQHLQPDGRCVIYAVRPQVCRDYDNDWCERDEPAARHFALHFVDHSALLAYCRSRFKRWS